MYDLEPILQKPVIEFDKYTEDFIWNYFFHTPVLTPKKVMNEIGVDVVSFFGSEAQAQRQLSSIAATAKNFIFGRLPIRSKDVQEFILSRDIRVLYDYLQYQMTFVIAATTSGSIQHFYEAVKLNDKTVVSGLESAAATIISKYRAPRYFIIPTDLLRKGY